MSTLDSTKTLRRRTASSLSREPQMSASQPTIADEIERYLRTGDADMDG